MSHPKKTFSAKTVEIILSYKKDTLKFTDYLKSKWLMILIALVVLISSLVLLKWFVFISSLFWLERIYSSAKKQMDLAYEEKQWLSRNQGRIIIYYATKSVVQTQFKNLLNELKIYESEIYYNGPKLVSTLRIPKSILKKISRSDFGHRRPSILKVEDCAIKVAINIQEIAKPQDNKELIIKKLHEMKALY